MFESYGQRPVLCSGTVLGNRDGIMRFLSILVDEFISNNNKDNAKCQSPTTTDQWIMNLLYYTGRFGRYDRIRTLPWGTGPVLTVGKPCMTSKRKSGAQDLIKRNHAGLIMNNWDDVVAPIIHQFDRCHPWIADYFIQHPELFDHFSENNHKFYVDQVQSMPWINRYG